MRATSGDGPPQAGQTPISITRLARPLGPGGFLAGGGAGIVVMDEGADSDQIIVADLDDNSDSIAYGDKDIRDGASTVDKDGRDWRF